MNRVRFFGGILTLLLFISSCVKEVSYYEEEIPKGNIVMKNQLPQRVSDEMILEIIAINDARCPVGVVCSEPGQIGIGFKVYVKGEFLPLEMDYDDFKSSKNSCVKIKGHVIEIVQVEPYPFNDGTTLNANDYRIEITVSKE